jgi:hypothetical protein
MGRFFIFIIIVSIALVLGMAFLVTHFRSARILLRCAARTTAEGRLTFPPRLATRRTSASAFIHGGLAALRSCHLSS